ncbi:restriction endonuclease subunit S [Rhodanobacter sp. C01]|uniref:restriction endonuclease subunit S n=1 Tax=Rhodanobacter sp. C01 TaxID=1945856 RepID=UPI00098680F8|nr:restriction endonuclease subunit S [Rhodanobacter sp. C01]OOG47663.1 hypothetical protein B0E50_09280 [Rhodanobacter sp. C01]
MSLPRYAEYKDSGVAWLGDVPSHWLVTPVKHLGKLKGGAGFPHVEQGHETEELPFHKVNALGRAGSDGVLRGSENNISRVTAERLGAYIFPAHALVFAKVGAALLLGRIRILGEAACIDNNMMGLVVNNDDVDVAFVSYALNLVRFDLIANPGAVPSLNEGQIGIFPLVLPSRSEQSAIAAFLDRETGKIDALIAEQEKLLTLLAEKRQATISHAVTRGLSPNAPMKDSGVRWLGEVPAHWEITSLGRISVSRCDGPFGSGIKSDHYTEEGALVVRLQNIRAYAFNIGEPVYLDRGYFETSLRGHEVVGGDLLVAGLGDENNLLGRACVAPDGLGAALVKADCFRFRLREEKALPHFVAMQLSAGAAFDAGIMATGTTRSRMPLGVMASRKVALPPLHEQSEIITFVDAKLSKFDVLKEEAEIGIALLKDRRSALIAAIVTGKIDVTDIA